MKIIYSQSYIRILKKLAENEQQFNKFLLKN